MALLGHRYTVVTEAWVMRRSIDFILCCACFCQGIKLQVHQTWTNYVLKQNWNHYSWIDFREIQLQSPIRLHLANPSSNRLGLDFWPGWLNNGRDRPFWDFGRARENRVRPFSKFFGHNPVLIDHSELSTTMPSFLNQTVLTFASERFSKNVIHMLL